MFLNPVAVEIFPIALDAHPAENCPTLPPSIPPAAPTCGPERVAKPRAVAPRPEALLYALAVKDM